LNVDVVVVDDDVVVVSVVDGDDLKYPSI